MLLFLTKFYTRRNLGRHLGWIHYLGPVSSLPCVFAARFIETLHEVIWSFFAVNQTFFVFHFFLGFWFFTSYYPRFVSFSTTWRTLEKIDNFVWNRCYWFVPYFPKCEIEVGKSGMDLNGPKTKVNNASRGFFEKIFYYTTFKWMAIFLEGEGLIFIINLEKLVKRNFLNQHVSVFSFYRKQGTSVLAYVAISFWHTCDHGDTFQSNDLLMTLMGSQSTHFCTRLGMRSLSHSALSTTTPSLKHSSSRVWKHSLSHWKQPKFQVNTSVKWRVFQRYPKLWTIDFGSHHWFRTTLIRINFMWSWYLTSFKKTSCAF